MDSRRGSTVVVTVSLVGAYLDHEIYENFDSRYQLALIGNDGDHSIG